MRARGAVRLLAVMLCLACTAPAYYHFVHFPSRNAPWRGNPEKFDLNILPNRTLTYFIDSADGVQLAPGDSYASLVSQIRAAAGVWNDVDSSDLRIAFGGLTSPGASQTSPSVDILFEELAPGVVAMGGPTVCGSGEPCRSVRSVPGNTSVPIVKAVVMLSADRSTRPSYTEDSFTTMVHEFGHALGLQHTLTSSVMSTSKTRSVSKAKPLSADDVAAISVLYPRNGFTQSTGTITGRVLLSGQSVNLASVVAISPNGSAVSTLTNPDGTYRIEGLPPRAYYVYAHPLPPAIDSQSTPADITYPQDADGRALPVGAAFETIFYTPGGGTKEPQQASLVSAGTGVTAEGINFNVRPRSGNGIHTVETYAFPANSPVKSPYLSPGITNPFVVATGYGMFSSTGPVAGLRATVLGGADLQVRPYPSAPLSYVQLDFDQRTLAVPSNSPRHVVLTANNNIYVLPSAFFHVDRQPPQILSVTPSVDGATKTVLLTGMNLFSDTRIFFDGVQAQARNYEDLGGNVARVTVVVPSASAGYRAHLAAFSSDGQSSLFVQSETPPVFVYPGDPAAAVPTAALLTPSALSPGVEALIQVDGLNTAFAEGQVSAGFGSSDLVVRRMWVISPTRLLVNVSVAPGAQPGPLSLTAASGLQILSQTNAFQIQAPPARPFWLTSTVTNTQTGGTTINPGSLTTIQVGAAPLALTPGNATVLVNDVRVPVAAAAGNQITFQLPSATPVGVATLRVETGGERSLPIAIDVDVQVPRILSAVLATQETRSPRGGDVLILSVLNLNAVNGQVNVKAGGREMRVLQLGEPQGDRQSVYVLLSEDVPTGDNIPVTITADKRTSEPVSITIVR